MSDRPEPGLPERWEDEGETLLAVLGSATRRGPWAPPARMRVVAVLGSATLDYREARFSLGVTELDFTTFLGSVEIIVPPDVDVEVGGSVILGSLEAKPQQGASGWLRRARERLRGEPPEAQADVERPLLSIDGFGLLGGVAVKVR